MSKETKTDECILQVKMNIPATSGGGRDLPRPKRWLRERCTSPVQGQAHNMRQNDAQAGITLGPLPIAGDRHLGVTHISPITPDTPLGEAAEAYLDHLLSLISCGLGSRENHHVREYGARFFGPLARLSLSSLRRSQIVLWADSLNNAKSESGNILVSARFTATVTLKAILSWCADRCDDLVNLPLLTRGIGGRYEPDVGRTLTLSEVQSLQDRLEIWAQMGPVHGTRPNPTRVNALRLLLCLCADGARGYEVRKATVAQLRLDNGGAIVLPKGKNRKARVIAMSQRSLEICKVQAETYAVGLLFPSHVTGRSIAGLTLNRILREAAVAAGIDNPDEISLHALRRSFAQIAYELGCTLEEIANAIGNTAAIVERHYVNTAISPIARRVNGMVNERRMG